VNGAFFIRFVNQFVRVDVKHHGLAGKPGFPMGKIPLGCSHRRKNAHRGSHTYGAKYAESGTSTRLLSPLLNILSASTR
jgi:hypothetical protein